MKKFTKGQKIFVAVFSILYIGLYWLCYILNFGWGSGSLNIVFISVRGMLPVLSFVVSPLFFAHMLAFAMFQGVFGRNSVYGAPIVVFLFFMLILSSAAIGYGLTALYKKIRNR